MLPAILGFAVSLMMSSPAAGQATAVTQAPGGISGTVIGQGGAPPRDTRAPVVGTSIVRGRIVDASTGAPLRKASVRITGAEIREMRSTSSDAEGRYEFRELPAGRFNVSASKSGYVDFSYGQSGPLEPGKPLQVGEKQTVEKIDFALPRGSVITGRVLDEYGDPIADVQVMPMRNQFTSAGQRPVPAGRSASTNDIGEFRLFGLAPGQYVISATYRPMMFNGASTDDNSGYAPTYYPGTPNIAEAQSLTIGAGGSVSDVTLMLVPTRTSRISGTAIDSQGQPVRQGSVMAMARTVGMAMTTAGGPIRPDGTFTITGVAPGEYTLRAMFPGLPGLQPEVMTAAVSVNGVDISDVRLEPMKPIAVTGRVILDPVAAQSFRPEVFRFAATPGEPMMFPGAPTAPPAVVGPDLTFEFKAYPGVNTVRMMGVPGWMIKSVFLDRTDVTDGITIGNEDISGLEIEMTNRIPDLSGLVTNTKGDSVKEYFAIAFPQDRDRWKAPGTGRSGMTRSDDEGRFRFRTLRPGDYYLAAVEHVQNGQWMDPEFLESLRGRATPITIGEGDSRTVDLKLIQER